MPTSVPQVPPPGRALVKVQSQPQARTDVQSAGGGITINTSQQLEDYLKSGAVTKSGSVVNASTAMKNGAVYACVRIITGPPATLPLQIKRRVDERTREDYSDSQLWRVLNRKPNRWQKPHQFKRLLTAQVLLRGDGIALKVRSRGEIRELIPLNPDRVTITQKADLRLNFRYQKPGGGYEDFDQDEIFHLYGLTLNGYSGVTPITYARETIGLALAQEDFGATTFANGARSPGALIHPKKIGKEGADFLRDSIGKYRAGGESEGQYLILEEEMKFEKLSLSATDSQWIESRKLSRSDIAMFFGVPPSMIGDNSGSDSNWGTGLVEKANGFISFALEDYLTMWEEAITSDLNSDERVYAKYNRAALVKSDLQKRWATYVQALQWGVQSPNEIRALEDMNPRDGGDIYYPPPNTAGKNQTTNPDDKGNGDVPPEDA